MKRISLMLAIPAMALVMACGGGAGDDPNGNGDGVVETPVVETEIIRVSLDDNGWVSEVPIDIEGGELFPINFTVGTTYEIHFTNNANGVRSLLIHRWGVEAIAQPGETTISNIFKAEVPGEYLCSEKILGRDARFKCLAIVS
jgi:hypothetical protein